MYPIDKIRVRALEQGIFSRPVRIKKTLDNGDCFYSSLYRALKERPVLFNCVIMNLELPDNPAEEQFISAFRQKIAMNLLDNAAEDDTYKEFTNMANKDKLRYDETMKSFPDWFIREFGNLGQNLGRRDDFYKRFIDHIMRPGEWVSEIEVGLATDFLNFPCNIRLIVWKEDLDLVPSQIDGKSLLWLYNPHDVHYEYFSFEPRRRGGKSRRRRLRRNITQRRRRRGKN
jgi:hypothetical protein